jgi:GntR family transcriptional regulator
VDSQLPLPKYHRIYLVLREQLVEGRFDAGLPGELALMKQFAVGRVTVRRALKQLAGEGLITRQPGRGTHPVKRAPGAGARRDRPVSGLAGLLENIVGASLDTTVTVVSVATVPATAGVAAALGLAPGAPVQKAVRVRSTREGPLSHITTYMPSDVARRFGRRELARKPILLLLEEAGVKVGRAEQSISARLADAEVAGRLQVAVGSALLAVRRLIFDQQERPVQWLDGLYRPDRYQYQMRLSRVGSVDAKVWVRKDTSANLH